MVYFADNHGQSACLRRPASPGSLSSMALLPYLPQPVVCVRALPGGVVLCGCWPSRPPVPVLPIGLICDVGLGGRGGDGGGQQGRLADIGPEDLILMSDTHGMDMGQAGGWVVLSEQPETRIQNIDMS